MIDEVYKERLYRARIGIRLIYQDLAPEQCARVAKYYVLNELHLGRRVLDHDLRPVREMPVLSDPLIGDLVRDKWPPRLAVRARELFGFGYRAHCRFLIGDETALEIYRAVAAASDAEAPAPGVQFTIRLFVGADGRIQAEVLAKTFAPRAGATD